MGKKTALEGGKIGEGVSLTKFDMIREKENSLLVAWIFTPVLTPPFALAGFGSSLLFSVMAKFKVGMVEGDINSNVNWTSLYLQLENSDTSLWGKVDNLLSWTRLDCFLGSFKTLRPSIHNQSADREGTAAR